MRAVAVLLLALLGQGPSASGLTGNATNGTEVTPEPHAVPHRNHSRNHSESFQIFPGNRTVWQAACPGLRDVPDFRASRRVQVITVEHFWNTEVHTAMLNYIQHTPYDWAFVFFHEPHWHASLSCSSPLAPHIKNGKVSFQVVDYLAQRNEPLDHKSYQFILRASSFWGSFPTDFVVLYERDSILCANPTLPWSHFLNVMKASSIAHLGAPWHPKFGFNPPCCNGGLSVINRPLLTSILRKAPERGHSWDKYVAWAVKHAKHPKATIPPATLSMKFSVETMYPGGYTPVGVHLPIVLHHYESVGRLAELVQRCPAVHRLRGVLPRKTSADNFRQIAAVLDANPPPNHTEAA
eukprot:EG_transcript_13649